jgi:uncharacterized protein (TIGR03382 family)
MNTTVLQIGIWLAAGLLLLVFMSRRRKRSRVR